MIQKAEKIDCSSLRESGQWVNCDMIHKTFNKGIDRLERVIKLIRVAGRSNKCQSLSSRYGGTVQYMKRSDKMLKLVYKYPRLSIVCALVIDLGLMVLAFYIVKCNFCN